MKVRLVRSRCFVLTILPFVDGVVCFISLCLLVFVFLNATRRENSGSMEFAETKELSRRSPRELKFVRYILRLEDLTKSVK